MTIRQMPDRPVICHTTTAIFSHPFTGNRHKEISLKWYLPFGRSEDGPYTFFRYRLAPVEI